MSRETDQTLVMIATVAGCLETLRQTHAFARVDIKRSMTDGFKACQHAIIYWPCMSNPRWIKERREEFKRFVYDTPDSGYSALALIRMCDRVMTDLMEIEGHNPARKAMLTPIQECVNTLINFRDPAGADFGAFDKAAYLIDELYRILEMKEFA
ncbi:MAG TPA: hypothetical protein DCZ63_15090 [Geobacter sp.]|nr:hypothetical protein [Geobacter sp.]